MDFDTFYAPLLILYSSLENIWLKTAFPVNKHMSQFLLQIKTMTFRIKKIKKRLSRNCFGYMYNEPQHHNTKNEYSMNP